MAEAVAQEDAGESVKIITVPDLLNAANWHDEIDFLKCDIEGAERIVFASCRNWITKVRNLLVELHGDLTPLKFVEMLEENGANFVFSVLQEGAGYSLVFLQASINKVCISS